MKINFQLASNQVPRVYNIVTHFHKDLLRMLINVVAPLLLKKNEEYFNPYPQLRLPRGTRRLRKRTGEQSTWEILNWTSTAIKPRYFITTSIWFTALRTLYDRPCISFHPLDCGKDRRWLFGHCALDKGTTTTTSHDQTFYCDSSCDMTAISGSGGSFIEKVPKWI